MKQSRKMRTQVFTIVFLLGISICCRAGLNSLVEEWGNLSKGARLFNSYMPFVNLGGESILFEPSALKEDMKFKLMLVTSAANNCIACVCSAVQALKDEKISEQEIVGLQSGEGIHSSKLSDKDKAILIAARELTLHPGNAVSYIEGAKKAGWSDYELANAVLIVSHFNAKNRIRIGFSLGPDKSHPYKPNQTLPMASCP